MDVVARFKARLVPWNTMEVLYLYNGVYQDRKQQFEFDMNPDEIVFFDEVHTDPVGVEDQIVARLDKAARAKVDVAARRANEDMEARVNTEAISSFYVQKPLACNKTIGRLIVVLPEDWGWVLLSLLCLGDCAHNGCLSGNLLMQPLFISSRFKNRLRWSDFDEFLVRFWSDFHSKIGLI